MSAVKAKKPPKPQTPPKFDKHQVREATETMKRIFTELGVIYVERDYLLESLMYACMMGEHQLVFGPSGTAKTGVVDAFFRAVDGARIFELDGTGQTQEVHLFGPYDPKLAREEGILEHRTEGMILEAQFANIGEILDMPEPTLRSLLSVLNERRFRRGRQKVNSPLQTAVGTTNIKPETLILKHEGLGAVVDRFIFQVQVGPVQSDEQRVQMMHKFLRGAEVHQHIKFEQLKYLRDLIVLTNLIVDDFILIVYNEILTQLRLALSTKRIISDRRGNLALQCVEASALLDGRDVAQVSDLWAVKSALVVRGDQTMEDIFDTVVEPIMETAVSKEETRVEQNISDIQRMLLDNIEGGVPDVDQLDESAQTLVHNLRLVKALTEQAQTVVPQNVETRNRQARLLADLELARDEILLKMNSGGDLPLPGPLVELQEALAATEAAQPIIDLDEDDRVNNGG